MRLIYLIDIVCEFLDKKNARKEILIKANRAACEMFVKSLEQSGVVVKDATYFR